MIQAEVQNSISQARSLMSTDPDAALQQLKLTLEKVRQTGALDPDVRNQYVDQLQTALREASRRKVEFEQARQQRMENVATARERELTRWPLTRSQEKVRQLMERFNSLMDERQFKLAEEAAATEVEKLTQPLNPNNPINNVAHLALMNARTIGYYATK